MESIVQIREEQGGDTPEIRLVNDEAFGQPTEGNIINALRQSCNNLLSLVAFIEGHLIGHILFSPVIIENGNGLIQGMGLGPMAVLPKYQRQGIGSKLVEAGLDMLKAQSCPFVIVLGHPDYYPRFGFQRASLHGIRSQWEGIPDEAFLVLILDELAMQGVSGIARYRREFDESI